MDKVGNPVLDEDGNQKTVSQFEYKIEFMCRYQSFGAFSYQRAVVPEGGELYIFKGDEASGFHGSTYQNALTVAADAFSDQAQLTLKRVNDGGTYLTNAIKCVERVGGVASVLPVLDGEYSLRAALLPRVDATCRKGDKGWEMEGAVQAELILRSADGGNRTCTLTLPFVFPLNIDGDIVEADGAVCGLKVRRQKNGETEAEATVQMQVRAYESREWDYIGETAEGEAYEKETAAVSVYALREGEELWDAAKRLRRNPDELVKSNPELEFPVKAGQRIFVYRKI